MLWEHPSLQAWMPLEGQNRAPVLGSTLGSSSVSHLGTQSPQNSLLFYKISSLNYRNKFFFVFTSMALSSNVNPLTLALDSARGLNWQGPWGEGLVALAGLTRWGGSADSGL